MKSIIVVLLLSLTLLPSMSQADSWNDPSYKEMIKDCDVIGIFRVVEGGSFKARLTLVTLFKGKLNGEIWLGGFSNRYGPIDKLSPGEVYLLFIHEVKDRKSRSSLTANATGVSKEAFEASAFVRSQSNGYFVPTPTRGEYRVKNDKVFIDLPEVNRTVDSLPLNDLKSLIAPNNNATREQFLKHCKDEIRKSMVDKNVYLLTNYLALLELAEYSSFDDIFRELASYPGEVRLILTKVLGNVEGNESRDMLVEFMDDDLGVVQGEAIRRLAKREPASFLGPLLIQHLESASDKGLHPPLMSPVRNTHESAQVEIIRTLVEMKYQPAIPHLLVMLRTTNNNDVFTRTLDALIDMGSKEFINTLNEKLKDPKISASMSTDIAYVVSKQKLIECKVGLLYYLANHNRNDNVPTTDVLSTLLDLAEHDPSIEADILKDFNHFFTYYETLESSRQENWFSEYLEACAALKSEKARPLVYRAAALWSGLNPERFDSPEAFKNKKQKEDSLRSQFKKTSAGSNYELNKVICFGPAQDSKARFMISVTIPGKANAEKRKFIADALSLQEDDVFLVMDQDVCWLDCQYRFQENSANSVILHLIKYIEAVPNDKGLQFLKSLSTSTQWEAKAHTKDLTQAITKLETSLSIPKK